MQRETLKMVVQPSPVVLPRNGISRKPPRPKDQQQSNYHELFDARTLFYDTIASDSGVTLIGPPLLNLQDLMTGAVFEGSNGEPYEIAILNLDRTSVVRLVNGGAGGDYVSISSEAFGVTATISPSLLSVFSDKKVLVTKSKDNDLAWISDWVKFHVAEQGIDAVLVYDNGSTAYGPEEVLQAIAVEGIQAAVVVNWPFKFGPQGGNWNGQKGAPWDSDFCEYSILEHARRRFLQSAAGVLNADIDELVMTAENKTVFDVMDELGAGVLSYRGRWIEATSRGDSSSGLHSDFVHYDPHRAATTEKWALVPSRVPGAIQWKTHWIPGVEMIKTTSTMHRHFMGVNSNWKWDRTSGDLGEKPLEIDKELYQAFERTFPDRF